MSLRGRVFHRVRMGQRRTKEKLVCMCVRMCVCVRERERERERERRRGSDEKKVAIRNLSYRHQ